MAGAKSKSKGQRGEYQAAAILQAVKDEVAESMGLLDQSTRIVRNLEQTRGGGFDLTGAFDFAVEVKNQEQFNLTDWWDQAVRQCPEGMVPVLMYKRANVKFRVRMYSYVEVGARRVRILADMDLPSFEVIFKLHCQDKFKEMQND